MCLGLRWSKSHVPLSCGSARDPPCVELLKALPAKLLVSAQPHTANASMRVAEGRVALLGDSAHAMQPNLGQGGCMAIEDGYQLSTDLAERAEQARAAGQKLDMPKVLQVRMCPRSRLVL